MLCGMKCWIIGVLLALPAWAQDADESAFELAGNVRTATGKPADAAVFVWDSLAEDRLLAQGRTDEKGRFLVTISREAAARREHPFGPVTIVVHQPGLARAPAAATPGARNLRFKLEKPGVWEGTVHSSDGTALPGAEVVAQQGRTRVATTTDEEGHFYFSDLAAAPTIVTADATGYRAATVREGALALVLERLPTTRGRLIDAVSKKALVGASIVDLGSNARAFTDDGGRFAIEMDGALLAVYLDSYAMTKVSFTGGDLELRRAESVRGMVVDDKGEPIAFTTVRLDPGFGAAAIARTDVTGAFGFSKGVASFAVASVRRRGFLPARVTVDPNWRTDRVKFVLARGRAVTAQVLDGGDPVFGAEVRFLRRVRPEGIELVGRAFSDASGNIRVPALAPSAMTAVAVTSNGRSAEMPVEDKMWFRVERSPVASGRVLDDAGAPVVGVTVRVEPAHVPAVTTDKDGRFSIADLRDGGYRMVIAASSSTLGASRTIRAGSRVELALGRIRGAGRARVTIVAARSGPARIALLGDGWKRVRWIAAGRRDALFEGLAPGTYPVVIDAPGFQTAKRELRVEKGGGEVKLDVDLPRSGTLRIKATPGARVFIQTVTGEPAPTVTVKLASGQKQVAGFGPGRYRFLSRAPGEAIVIREINVGERDAPRDLDLTGGKASTMSVIVVDEDNVPVRGASIELITEGGFVFRTGKRTDADGKAELSRLILGRMRVIARVGDETAEVSVAIKPGMAHQATIVTR